MQTQIKAVITCDLMNSSKYNAEDRHTISKRMNEFVEKWNGQENSEYIIYRGDSIQGLLHNPREALKQALFLKSFIKSIRLSNSKRATITDIRASIGLGTITYQGTSILDSDGQAFQNSGRTLDQMKKKGRSLALTSPDAQENNKWEVIMLLMEDVIDQWTIQSAEIIWRLIDGWSDRALQDYFNISQPAVSQRKKHASWDALKETLSYYEKNCLV